MTAPIDSRQLQVEALSVSYGKQSGVRAIDNVTLELSPGEFGVLLGPSGCGKSTILNAIAGLADPTDGRISLRGRPVFDARAGIALPPEKRDLGMVFQSYALWPHLSVADNVGYPLKRRGIKGDEYGHRIAAVLKLVACGHLADRLPAQLSGGQQQRIALARAMVGQPQILLFDEPLSNLDAQLRRSLRDELARMHRELHFTALYVTHDQSEALALGTQLFVMDVGRIVQQGVPTEVYRTPATEYVASFFAANLLDGEISPGKCNEIGTAFGMFALSEVRNAGRYRVAAYPERVKLQRDSLAANTVRLAEFLGARWEYTVEAISGEQVRVASGPEGYDVVPGDRVALAIDSQSVTVFPAGGSANLNQQDT